jgi:cell wall-associated NlpC family hydrolase
VSYIMKKLGELLTLLVILSAVGSAQVAVADPEPFEYTPTQIIYVQEDSFYDRYSKAGPLASLAMQQEFQMEMEKLRAETMEARAFLIKEAEEAEADVYYNQQIAVDAAITALWSHIGTPYGFGNTPLVWDCSGLTQWYLNHRGFQDVIHSATAQVRDIRSQIVDAPIAGDLVAFQKSGASSYFHIGVYIGGGLMIHASNPEKDTNLQTVDSFAESENSRVVYLRW